MKEITYRIPDESADAITTLVQQLGGTVENEKQEVRTAKKVVSKKKKKEVSPTFLFGKWKDFDIDAKKLREDSWRRKF